MVRYMIVEDDEMVLRATSRLALSHGFDVKGFLYPDEDIFRYNETMRPDVVQLDGLEGACFEVHERLRVSNPGAHYVVYSSEDSPAFIADVVHRGMVYLSKFKSTLDNYLTHLEEGEE